jgi:GNAT superfamily N-acetyltransferase
MNKAILESVHIKIEEEPEDTLLQRIQNPLRAYNETKIGPYSAKKFALLAYNGEKLIGDMSGWLQWGWFLIDWTWVDESHHRKKVGTALLLKFEEIARRHGVSRARLNTASSQEGLSFYESHHYRVFAKIEITTPAGREYIDYFLRKDAL